MKPASLLLATLIGLGACADSGARHAPILDGPETAAYRADLSACQTLAKTQRQFDQETLGAAVLGAGLGAALGAAEDEATAGEGAAVGLIGGGLAGAVNTSDRRQAIVIQCLRGRGHRVVG
ncbi:glycine zipper family protein [Aquicoccus sp. SU-CL01552]|uniref:glycine zipper family protein n=1 Tax=Aquicoccus sp. SU-CL01552 TaxID=3127656 RepID=UPI0031030888